MTDNNTPHPYPVRDPAPGPAVILDLPTLWAHVEDEMVRRGMTKKNGTPELKQLSELVGLDRNTLGRTRQRALNGEIVEGQRGGLNVNAYLTLVSFVRNGRTAAYGRELRGGVTPYTGSLTDPRPVDDSLDGYAIERVDNGPPADDRPLPGDDRNPTPAHRTVPETADGANAAD